VLAWGNLNDECHTFSANDDAIWVCRRWDFTSEGASKGYQIARLSASCGTAELPTSPEPNQLELYPRPTADEGTLYYTIVEIAAGKQTRRLVRKSLPDGLPETVVDSATLAQISPDGTRLLFSDHTQAGALFTMKLDGSELVKVASQTGTSAVWSADGSKIAYLWDETQTCHHVQMVAADGSQADSPVRVRDCGSAFITELAWLSVP
jgi:Tol biopolymer transport system component